MSLWQILSGIVLLLSGIFLVIVVLLQEPKQTGSSGVITGGSNDSYYDKNKSRTKEIQLQKLTKAMAIIFFLLTLVVNMVPIVLKNIGQGNSGNNSPTTSVASTVDEGTASQTASNVE